MQCVKNNELGKFGWILICAWPNNYLLRQISSSNSLLLRMIKLHDLQMKGQAVIKSNSLQVVLDYIVNKNYDQPWALLVQLFDFLSCN